MPKEITYGESPYYLAMPDGNEFPEGSEEAKRLEGTGTGKWRRRGAEVSWVKGRFVELGVASFDPSRELPKDGVFITLDRAGINRLIWSLRRARDQAYGKDA